LRGCRAGGFRLWVIDDDRPPRLEGSNGDACAVDRRTPEAFDLDPGGYRLTSELTIVRDAEDAEREAEDVLGGLAGDPIDLLLVLRRRQGIGRVVELLDFPA